MNYVDWWWYVFAFDKWADMYKPHATALCRMVFPCHLYWQENYLGKPANDNTSA